MPRVPCRLAALIGELAHGEIANQEELMTATRQVFQDALDDQEDALELDCPLPVTRLIGSEHKTKMLDFLRLLQQEFDVAAAKSEVSS